ncbi:MAG: branched-chain amino acid ABC transporter permease [Candidatus Bathyarchaeia archaeon]
MANYILQQIINALGYGGILGLLGIGYTIIYGVAGLINFAHGEIFMISAVIAYFIGYVYGQHFVLTIIAAIAAGIVCGLSLNEIIYQPCIKRRAPILAIFIASFGASIFLRYLLMMILTDRRRPFPIPQFLERVLIIGTIAIPLKDLITLGVTILAAVFTAYIVKFTRIGIALRAVAYDKLTAQTMGVSIASVVRFAFLLGSLVAGVAALAYGISFRVVHPTMGFVPGLYGFMAAVIGGIGNVWGAFVAGILLGFAEIFIVGFFPPSLSPLRPFLVWTVLILIMLLKPAGLFRPNIKFEEVRQ